MDGPFTVDESGEVYLNTSLNARFTLNYVVLVQVRDRENEAAARSSQGQILVTILDINDNEPTFEPTPSDISLNEEESSGQLLLTFRAFDLDISNPNNVIRYFIEVR